FGHDTGPSLTFIPDRFGFGLVPQPVRPGFWLILTPGEFFIEPFSLVGGIPIRQESRVDFPVGSGYKFLDRFLALDEYRQRRCLDSANCCFVESAFLRIECGHGPGTTAPYQPV